MNVSDAFHFLKILSSLKVAFKRGTQSLLWLTTQRNKSESFKELHGKPESLFRRLSFEKWREENTTQTTNNFLGYKRLKMHVANNLK